MLTSKEVKLLYLHVAHLLLTHCCDITAEESSIEFILYGNVCVVGFVSHRAHVVVLLLCICIILLFSVIAKS